MNNAEKQLIQKNLVQPTAAINLANVIYHNGALYF